MVTAAIIAEYNPFHNGHKYHIEKTRQMGATHVAVLMSGSLVQRGEFASFSKHTRAKAALLNGADLVLELPCIYSISCAQRFAFGAVNILNSLGVIDILSFGSESGSLDKLKTAAKYISLTDGSETLKQFLKSGVSYPAARQKAFESLPENLYELLENPNDTLGIEYLCALEKLSSPIKPAVVKREGAGHDSRDTCGGFASASMIRSLIKNPTLVKDFVPENTFELYINELESEKYTIDRQRFETAILYALKSLDKEGFAALPDVSEGLENRLYDAARKALSLEEFIELVKTKRYTHARIRRIAMYALVGILRKDQFLSPAYVRVLGMNSRGMEILAKARKSSQIPVLTSFSKIMKTRSRQASLDLRAGDLHGFLSAVPQRDGTDFLLNPVILS